MFDKFTFFLKKIYPVVDPAIKLVQKVNIKISGEDENGISKAGNRET